MNIVNIVVQFILFSFLAFNIALILGLITAEDNFNKLQKVILRNLGFIYLTVLILAIFATVIPLIF